MLLKELRDKIGQEIEYWVIDGIKYRRKKAKVYKGLYTRLWYRALRQNDDNYVTFLPIDKLGRENSYNEITINISNGDKNYFEIGNKRCFFSEEEAYSHIMQKLRNKRQEINKKMMKVQKLHFCKAD